MNKQNIILIFIESLGYQRVFNPSLPPEYQLSEIKALSADSAIFHKCINVANSTWMSIASTLFGTAECYHHNKSLVLQERQVNASCTDIYSKSLFDILESSGYIVKGFTTPDNFFPATIKIVSEFGPYPSLSTEQYGKYAVNTFDNVMSFIQDVKHPQPFALTIMNHLDHVMACGIPGPEGRLTSFLETSRQIGRLIEFLKHNNLYNSTDIYLIGDHSDSKYILSETTKQYSLLHGGFPFHSTTHVPLIVKSSYVGKGDKHHLVSNIDLYSTILNSLQIPINQNSSSIAKLHIENLSQLYSIDLTTTNRNYVVSTNTFKSQDRLGSGVSITSKDYVYVVTCSDIDQKKSYLFHHIEDNLNSSNLLCCFDYALCGQVYNHPHHTSWFNKSAILNTVTQFQKTYNMLVQARHIRSDIEDPIKIASPTYWHQAYTTFNDTSPSTFAEFTLGFINPQDHPRLVDLGCGNGRDAAFFYNKGYKVLGIDQCKIEGSLPFEFIQHDLGQLPPQHESFDVAYCRFVLHSITAPAASNLIKWTHDNLRSKGLLCIEARSTSDPKYGKGLFIGHNEFLDPTNGHYRRFIDYRELVDYLQANGFFIIFCTEGRNFSPYGNDNPILIRIIAQKV